MKSGSQMSKKNQEPPKVFEATILIIGKKLASGNTYPQEIADQIVLGVTTGEQKYTVEEVAPVDRGKNGIQPYESWKQRAMATSIEARIEGNRLIMSFQIYKNQYGKKLALMLENNPPGKLEFFPVGIGDTNKDGVVVKYKLVYISFEVKNEVSL